MSVDLPLALEIEAARQREQQRTDLANWHASIEACKSDLPAADENEEKES